MDEISHNEMSVMVTDLFAALYAQQELVNKLNCKMAVTQRNLNDLEAKLAQLKRKKQERNTQTAVTN